MEKISSKSLKRNFVLYFLFWTLCIVGIFLFSCFREKRNTLTVAKESAEHFTTLAVNIVKWISLHGGVYVGEDNATKPSIYFTEKVREITTKENKKYAYIDVSSLLREISSLGENRYKAIIKLTSLTPLNPKNSPDEWEKKALKIIQKKEKPYYEFYKDRFRYMYPLKVGKNCLRCHFLLNLKVGELRGGISISIPAQHFLEHEKTAIVQNLLFFSFIWIIGSVAVILFYLQNRKLIKEISVFNRKFRIIFEHTNLPMVILRNGIIIDCNTATLKFFQGKREDIVGKNLAELSPEKQPDGKKSIESFSRIFRRCLKDREATFEWVFKKIKGEAVSTIVSASVFEEEKVEYIFVSIQDISNIKELENRLQITLNSIREAVITTDISQRITFVNKTAEKLLETSLENVKGEPFGEAVELFDIKTSEPIKDLEKFLKTRKRNIFHKARLSSKAIVEFSIEFLQEKPGILRGFVVVIRDITEQEKVERELARITTLEKIGTLAGGLAHDFNNLLTGIYGNLFLLKEKISDDNVKNYIERIEKSLDSAKDLTEKLLTFAKGGTPLKKVQNIKKLLEDVPEFYTRGTKVKLVKNIADNLWSVRVDPGQFSQVIANIVINAVEAMEDGGVLEIEAENFTHTHSSELLPKGDYIKISFKDSGIGIDKKIADKIFDPFFTTKKDGTGLGLSIVQSIVENHNGKIFVDSKKGAGTTFTIYLPAIKTETNAKDEEEYSEEIFGKDGKALKVLVMDDEDVVRETFLDMLKILGCRVDIARDGDEALKKVKTSSYDVIILDLTVPGGKGGKEVVREIHDIAPEAKIIATSGYSIENVLANYREYGFSQVLKKPFTLNELKKVIAEVVKS